MRNGSETDLETRLLWRGHELKVSPGIAPEKGRGLFAIAPIAQGEIIDRACTARIEIDQCLVLDKMHPVGDFYYAHPEDEKLGLMVFGLPSLLNHADSPNADVRFRLEGEFGYVAELIALRHIERGEELTYRYKCPLWFDRRD